MATTINQDECIQCGACQTECPEGAIIEVDGKFFIEQDKCKDCSACADVCPTSAITLAA